MCNPMATFFGIHKLQIKYQTTKHSLLPLFSGINRNEGTLFVGRSPMIPDVSFETIENNPQAAYHKAISHLVVERVCLFSYSH